LHVPIEGDYPATEKIEEGVAVGEKTAQNHVENAERTYLERIRNGMQKPIEGLFSLYVAALNKGGGYSHRGQQTLTPKQQTENFVDRFLCSA
jgi:hypothetical protein